MHFRTGTLILTFSYFLALHAQNHGGPHGWKVINYFLGACTIFAGLLVLSFLGTPQTVWWLTPEEKKMAHARIVSNGSEWSLRIECRRYDGGLTWCVSSAGGGEQHPWKWEQVKECFRDPQFYFAILFNIMTTIPNGAIGTFSVLVGVSFGFTNLQSLLYGQPANAIGCVACLFSAIVITRYPRTRFPFVLVWNLVPVIVLLYVGLGNGDSECRTGPYWALYSS